MKNIILSDIHGNIEALLAVIEEIIEKENPVNRLIVAGDIVGYGASPNECCNIIRYLIYGRRKVALEDVHKIILQTDMDVSKRKILMDTITSLEKKCTAVGGNHDKEAAGEPSLTSEMNPVAQAAVDWTKGVLTKENIKFLKNLPFRKKFGREGFEIVHGTPAYPQGYEYVRNAGTLKYNNLWSKVTFGGHTHRPAAYIYTKEMKTVNASVLIPADNYDMRLMLIERQSTNRVETFDIDMGSTWKYYINVGSVGQPRDGNPCACYVVFDSTTKSLCFRRVPYNTESASGKIVKAKLPQELAQRIEKGV